MINHSDIKVNNIKAEIFNIGFVDKIWITIKIDNCYGMRFEFNPDEPVMALRYINNKAIKLLNRDFN